MGGQADCLISRMTRGRGRIRMEIMKTPRLLLVGSLGVFALVASGARGAEIANPATVGFDAVRLGRLDAMIQAQVEQKKIAGVVLYVARDGKEVRHRGYGMSDVEAGKAMTTDAIFRIASMSKAVTTTAVMMLYEEGKFMLHDSVSKYIPEFQNSVVAVPAPEGALEKFITVKVKRPMQIRDLLTHTAGLTYGTGPAAAVYKRRSSRVGILRIATRPLAMRSSASLRSRSTVSRVKSIKMVTRPMCSDIWSKW
jgi:CubicO group peptidase (beta-lactamase class C family)